MSNSTTEPAAEAGTIELTEPEAVLRYLQGIPLALRVLNVQRLPGGMINFVYRLVLDQAIEDTKQNTAILKYSAPYVAGDPSTGISPNRQIFEARAFKEIPWKRFHYSSSTLLENAGFYPKVALPELYFEDPTHHVVVMQDCSTEAEKDWHPEKAANPFRFFCEHLAQSEIKYQTARTIGSMLGSFLAQLHEWGLNTDSHLRVVELFGANNDSTRLLVEVHTGNFFKSVSKTGYQLSQEQQRALETCIRQLGVSMYEQRDTVIVGDFQLGNVLLNFGEANHLSSISIIDWEFVTIGPSFVDIGNFIGELFCTGYLNSIDSTYAEVLDSFMLAYRAFGGLPDVRRAIAFVGAGIIESLPRRMRYSSRGTAAMARKCVEHALRLIVDTDSADSASGENDPFASLSRILRDCQSEGE